MPISSVVLSSQRVTTEALYNVAKDKDQAKAVGGNPLVQDGQKLIPSVTRVFSKGTEADGLPAGIRGAAAGLRDARRRLAQRRDRPRLPPRPGPLVAFVTFYRDNKKVYETQPEEVSPWRTRGCRWRR